MIKLFLGLVVFILPTLVMVQTIEQTREDSEQFTSIEPPALSSIYLLDDYDIDGELCDPNEKNSCESPLAECIWSHIDMMYRCSSQRVQINKRNLLRKRQVKRKKSLNLNSISGMQGTLNSENTVQHQNNKHIENLSSKSSKQAPMHVGVRSISPSSTTKMGEQSSEPYTDIPPHIGDQARLARQGRQNGGGTNEVPEYEGLMTWDGYTEISEQCITKTAMAEALQELKPLASKNKWIEDNKDLICDFTKFFHCTLEEVHTDLGGQVEDEDYDIDPGENTPACRCYESSMPVVRGVCYISADFGTKSACGDHVIAPYPIQPWKGAPVLRPKCTPNSDCKESQYWFGTRCTCRYNAKWNSKTHACDKAIRIKGSFSLLLVTLPTLFLSFRI